MQNTNTQQTGTTKTTDSEIKMQHSKLNKEGYLQGFTHSGQKAPNEAEIKENDSKINEDILPCLDTTLLSRDSMPSPASRDAMLASLTNDAKPTPAGWDTTLAFLTDNAKPSPERRDAMLASLTDDTKPTPAGWDTTLAFLTDNAKPSPASRDAMLASLTDDAKPTPAGCDDETQNSNDDLWESNHALITKAIHELIKTFGRVPTKKELAIKTGLSRPTIHKHLKGFAMHPLFTEKEEQFQMLSSNVMAMVYEFAMHGDPRAARLYFEITGKLKN